MLIVWHNYGVVWQRQPLQALPPPVPKPQTGSAALTGKCGLDFTAATAGVRTCQSSSSPFACTTVQNAHCPCLQMRRAGQALAELNGQQKAVALGGSSKARYREAQVGAANECARRLENHSLAELQDQIAVLQQQLEIDQQVHEVAVSSVHLMSEAVVAGKCMYDSPLMCMHGWLLIGCVCFTHSLLPCRSFFKRTWMHNHQVMLCLCLAACSMLQSYFKLWQLWCWHHTGSQAHISARLFPTGLMPS